MTFDGALILLLLLLAFPIGLPWLAIGLVKRMHDVGMGGKWLLIPFIPFIGLCIFVMLYFVLAFAESGGPNKYGLSPAEPNGETSQRIGGGARAE